MATLSPDKVRFIVVHCSASPPQVYVDAAVIDRWHRARGFFRIGYHFVIKRDGTVESGRSTDEIGAHVEGFNACSIGVCMAGGVNDAGKAVNDFTAAQWTALSSKLTDLTKQFPQAAVQGHRDFPNVHKDCPCFDVKPWWSKQKGKQ